MTRRLAILIPCYLLLFAGSYAASYAFRFEFDVPEKYQGVFLRTLPFVLALKLTIFLVSKDWRRSFRYVTLSDVASFTTSVALATTLLFLANLLFIAPPIIPRSIVLLDGLLLLLGLCVARGGLRYYHETVRPFVGRVDSQRAIIVGSGRNAIGILRTLRATDPNLRIVGLVSDGSRSELSLVSGVSILTVEDDDWTSLVQRLGVGLVLVPSSVPGRTVRTILRTCRDLEVGVHVIPEVRSIVDGRYTLGRREVTINDLLRREPADLDIASMRACITGQRVLVTGAAGSIGSELCRQILDLRPSQLVFYDQSEFGMFEIETEVRRNALAAVVETEYVIGDVRDREALARVFDQYRPQLVFHAAAYKHVPMMERNPRAAIVNNVIGTWNVCDFASRHAVDRFVLISTDKAVRPTSVMGASKLLAEKVVQSAAEGSATRFITVRFGNVLNSSGSVVPTFRRQLESGGPLTVTHPDMERYFLTIPEAVQLVLQAGAVGKSGDVLVLEMGEPVKIVDLARDMILLSGHDDPEDVGIVFSGIRPGEKLREELFYNVEEDSLKVHDKIFKVRAATPAHRLVAEAMQRLENAIDGAPEIATAALWAEVTALVDEDELGHAPVPHVDTHRNAA